MALFGFGTKSSFETSQATASTFTDPATSPFFQALFGASTGLAGQQLPAISEAANALAPGLLTSGQSFIEGLQGGAGGLGQGVGQSIAGLLDFGGAGGLPGNQLIQGAGASAQALLGPNPALGPQISILQDIIQNNLQATAGTIAGQATLQGATGGSRQALATGLAGQEAQRQFAAGASSLLSQDFASRQALAPQLVGQQIQAGLALNQGALGQTQQQLAALTGAGNLGVQSVFGQTGAAGTGLGQLGGLFDLGLAPFGAEFSPLVTLAQIFGQPTVLSRQQATSRAGSSEFEVSIFGS